MSTSKVVPNHALLVIVSSDGMNDDSDFGPTVPAVAFNQPA